MADSVLVLSDFITDFKFEGFEVPGSLPFGGSQIVVSHKLVGGKKVVQAMGADPRPVSWSGRFRGQNAVQRALFLDDWRASGRQLSLTWAQFSYSVVIASFLPEYERFYEVPYQISLEVLEDLTSRPAAPPALGYTDLINNDATMATATAASVGDSTLNNAMAALNSAISKVSDFAKATTTEINSVLTPLATAQARVKLLISTTENTVNSVATVGGIFPNNPIARNVAALNNQVVAIVNAPQLYNLQSVLGRIGGNIGQLNPATSGKQVTVGGGTLFDVAAQNYGDATQWDKIAAANSMNDPVLSGIQTITVPN